MPEPNPSPWIEIHVLLSERRDELSAMAAAERDPAERLRIEGALRELTWLLEQVQESWGRWAYDK